MTDDGGKVLRYEDVMEALTKAYGDGGTVGSVGPFWTYLPPEPAPRTVRQRLVSAVWTLRWRIAHVIYPFTDDQ